MRWLRRWWRQRDRFDWCTSYLIDRGLQRVAQLVIAGVIAAFAVVTGVMLASPGGPQLPSSRVAAGAAAVVGAALAALWLLTWPTLNQSRCFVVISNACIATACLAQSNPIAGLTGCYTFIVLGAYIALMHCAKGTVANFVVSIVVAAILVFRVYHDNADLILAGCQLAILALFSIGAPVALNVILHILATDISRSDHDALTGLLNRRGFYRHTSRLIDKHARAGGGGYLTIAMVDLDDFKHINDTYGHSTGDKALIEVGRALREHSEPAAVVARAGGEEFLLATLCCTAENSLPAATLCRAIAQIDHDITASIGSVSAPIGRLEDVPQDVTALIDELIVHADTAMYAAKTAGGNQYRHHRGPPFP